MKKWKEGQSEGNEEGKQSDKNYSSVGSTHTHTHTPILAGAKMGEKKDGLRIMSKEAKEIPRDA